jgi:hypothetical protein
VLTERAHASEVVLDAALGTRVEGPTAQPKADKFCPGRISASFNGKPR